MMVLLQTYINDMIERGWFYSFPLFVPIVRVHSFYYIYHHYHTTSFISLLSSLNLRHHSIFRSSISSHNGNLFDQSTKDPNHLSFINHHTNHGSPLVWPSMGYQCDKCINGLSTRDSTDGWSASWALRDTISASRYVPTIGIAHRHRHHQQQMVSVEQHRQWYWAHWLQTENIRQTMDFFFSSFHRQLARRSLIGIPCSHWHCSLTICCTCLVGFCSRRINGGDSCRTSTYLFASPSIPSVHCIIEW